MNFRFKKSNFTDKEPKLSEYIPWLFIDKNGVVYNKDDSLQLTFSFRGPDLDSSTTDELINYHKAINNVIKRAKTGYVFYIENQRRKSERYEISDFDSVLGNAIEEERKEFFENGSHYENYYYFTILFHPTFQFTKKFLSIFESKEEQNSQLSSYSEQIESTTKEFLQEASDMISLLEDIFLEVKLLNPDETLTYLHSTISDHYQPIKNIPTMYLSSYLLDSDFVGGANLRLGNKYVKVISMLGYPGMTEAGVFDVLNHIGFEYRWVSRFHALTKMDADSIAESKSANFGQQAKSILQYAIEAVRNTVTEQVNEAMLSYKEECDEARQLVEQDFIGLGYYSFIFVVADEDPKVLERKVSTIMSIIQGKGYAAKVETWNAEKAFFGSVPGMWQYHIRKDLVSTLNFSHLAPTNGIWSGEKRNNDLKGPVLLHTETIGSTPFRLSLHAKGVGHALVAGPTGAGKSVLLNMIETHFTKYHNAQLFVFDVGGSARAITKAMGGNFYNIMSENGLAFQPLARIGDRPELAGLSKEEQDEVKGQEMTWASNWILNYLKFKNITFPEVELLVKNALISLSHMEPELRTISSFIRIVQNQQIRQALEPLSTSGLYGKLFDNSKDNFGTGRWQVFEMEDVMKYPDIVPTVLDFLFHRIDSQLTGNPTLIVLDECWLFFANPIFEARIRDYFKALRKKNASIIVATQNLSDITQNQALANTIVENCHTQLLLPNSKATREGIREHYIKFGLNQRQIEILTELEPREDYYVVSPLGNRIFKLAVQPLEGAFVLSTSKEDQLQITKMEEEGVGQDEFIERWLTYKELPTSLATYQRVRERGGL